MTRSKFHPVTDYARRVVSGKENVCELIKLSAQRHLDDLKRTDWPYVFSEDKADHVVGFLRHLKHYKGVFAGKNFEPLPWQIFFAGSLFGWVNKETNLRRFKRAYLEVPRKNGKTFLCGGLGLYGLFGDQEEGAEIYIAATSKDQASLAYKDSIKLYKACDELHGIGKQTYYDLQFPSRNGILKSKCSEHERLDGLNPHFAIFDELHAWKPVKGEALWDVFADGMGARVQPLIIAITTAGFNQMGVCWTRRQHLVQVLKKKDGFEDDKLFGMVFTLDEGDDWKERESWFKANPNLGNGKVISELEDQVHDALQIPSRENPVKNKHFNIWTKAQDKWLDSEKWDNCGVQGFDIESLYGQTCYIGVDLSATQDLTCCSYIFPVSRDRKKLFIYPRFFIPEATADTRAHREKIPYPTWIQKGYITGTPGNVVDYDFIRAEINDFKSKLNIKEIGIDPWNQAVIAPKLISDGFEVVQVRQGFASFSAPSKEFEKMIMNQSISHDGNPVMGWCVENAAIDRDPAENIKPTKSDNPFMRIDGVSATITGLARVFENDGYGGSVYESRGLRVIR